MNYELHAKLEINGDVFELSPDYSLRFAGPHDSMEPVLYRKGKRVVRPWRLTLFGAQYEAGQGNANTE